MTIILNMDDVQITIKINSQVNKCFNDTIKNCAKLTTKLIKAAYKSKFIKFKLDEDPLQRQVYLLSFMIYLKIVYHHLRKLICCF